jgi:hypothetical protein
LRKLLLLSLLTLVCAPPAAQAASFTAVYEDSNTCPVGDPADFTNNERQYKVDDAIKCMYIDVTTGQLGNPKGGVVDTNNFLNSADALAAGWIPDLWTGLGSDEQLGGLDGFTFTGAGGNSGTFWIDSPLTDLYDQFAIAVKDGGDPKFAIFLLPVGDFSSAWSITSAGGTLSHFALYGRSTEDPDLTCPDGTPAPCPLITETPEPASLLLMGAGLAVAGKIRNRRKKK